MITIAEQILKVPLQIFHSVQDPRTCEQPKERTEFLTDSMEMTIRFNFFFFLRKKCIIADGSIKETT